MESIAHLFVIYVLLALLAGFAFWIWMIVDCATKESNTGNDKVVWIIVIVFTQIIGALIYYFARRRPRRFAEWQASTMMPQRR